MIIDILKIRDILKEELKKINPNYELKLLIDENTYEFQISERFKTGCSILRLSSDLIALGLLNDFKDAIEMTNE